MFYSIPYRKNTLVFNTAVVEFFSWKTEAIKSTDAATLCGEKNRQSDAR